MSEHLWRHLLLEQDKQLRLRRINRIRAIQGSLAIEGNRLSGVQITAILEGKRVIAPPKEIQEARTYGTPIANLNTQPMAALASEINGRKPYSFTPKRILPSH